MCLVSFYFEKHLFDDTKEVSSINPGDVTARGVGDLHRIKTAYYATESCKENGCSASIFLRSGQRGQTEMIQACAEGKDTLHSSAEECWAWNCRRSGGRAKGERVAAAVKEGHEGSRRERRRCSPESDVIHSLYAWRQQPRRWVE